MKETKLITILKQMLPKELKRFYDFVASPYFNKNESIVHYVNYLSSLAPLWQDDKLTENAQFSAVFPQESFDKQKLYYLRSNTNVLLEKFWAHEQLSVDETAQELAVLKFYSSRNFSSYFELAYKKWANTLKNIKLQDGKYYYTCFETNWVKITFESEVKQAKMGEELLEQKRLLDVFYVINSLSLHISIIAMRNVFTTQSPQTIPLSDILYYVENAPELLNIPIIQILYYHLKMLLEPDNEILLAENLNRLKNNLNIVPTTTSIGLFSAIRNRYVTYINQGNKEYEEKLFYLYKQQIESHFILDENQEIKMGIFNNICTLALRQKKMDWLKGFITEYGEKLPIAFQKNVLLFTWAKYYFVIEDYSTTLKYLIQIDTYPDIFADINARKLLIQTYYALDEMSSVVNILNSFRVFLSRDKQLSSQNKTFYLNFANAMHKLVQFRENDFEQIEKYYALIESLNPPEKEWFILQGQQKEYLSIVC